MRVRSGLHAVVVAALLVGVSAAPAGAEPPGTVGAPGVGDSLFPLAGNGGIDVQDYDLRLAYDPGSRKLDGTATLRVVATQNLSRFDLDLRELTLGVVTVDGAPARTARSGQELQITPQREIRKGAAFTVVVPYSGVPKVVVDADGSSEGFVPTRDGAVVVNEPQGSPGWYPANDTPRDKATYTVAMTVPNGLTAVGNGSLVSQTTAGGRTTFTWRERFPMAPYLTTITLGKFTVATGRPAAASPPTSRSTPPRPRRPRPCCGSCPTWSGSWRTYTGATRSRRSVRSSTTPLTSATRWRPRPSPSSTARRTRLTLLHELSHQWYGDAVTLRDWKDIWLHEGFATWSEWIWTERHGGKPAAQQLAELAATPASDTDFWNPPPGNPGKQALLFDGTIYERGGMTLQALREKIGDRAFLTVMRRWYAEHKYGNGSTQEFVALAQQVSGQKLGDFFQAWLYTPGKPPFLTEAPAAAGTVRATIRR